MDGPDAHRVGSGDELSGLRALLDAGGQPWSLHVDAWPATVAPSAVAVVVLSGREAAGDPSALLDAVRAGARAVLAVDPAAGDAVAALGLPAPSPDVLTVPDPDDLLVLATRLEASGAGGSVAGWTLQGDRFGAVTGGEAWFCAAGVPVAATMSLDAGAVVVLGSAQVGCNHWLAAGDNAAVWHCAVGHDGPADAAVALARSHRPRPRSEHPPIPVVTAGDADDLAAAVPTGLGPADEDFLVAAARAGRLLPAAVHDALVDFADSPSPAGALLLRGLPMGDVPPTPPTPTTPTGKDHVSELVLLAVARRLGQPVGYEPEHGGDVVQNLAPTRRDAERQTSTSSAVTLAFHTETAFHRHRPRYLLLACLRGDPAAATLLCAVPSVLDELPLGVRHVLGQPRFTTMVDESFTGRRPTTTSRPFAVLSGDPTAPTVTFDADLMAGIDDEAQRALDALGELVAGRHAAVALEAGDVLVVDNDIAVHGRSPFTARFDGTDRWLQRTFVVADLAASRGERRGRVITTRFAA